MFKLFSTPIFFLFFALTIHAPAFASGGGDDDPPLIIDGMVLDLSDAPISGATAELYKAGQASPIAVTYTESDGSFGFENVSANTYDLLGHAPGYETVVYRLVLTQDATVTIQVL